MNTTIRRTLLTFFAVLLPALSFATALDQFRSFVATVKSAQGDFTQRQVRMIDGSPRLSTPASGSFAFARPGRFIWIYEKPYQQTLLADGENLYIHDKDLNQVTIRKLGNALGNSPAAVLLGSHELEKNFTLREIGEKEGLKWLEATPRARDTSFEAIGIGMRNGLPEAMELRDSFGQVTLLTFRKFVKNPALKPGQFKFVPPKGADVLRQ